MRFKNVSDRIRTQTDDRNVYAKFWTKNRRAFFQRFDRRQRFFSIISLLESSKYITSRKNVPPLRLEDLLNEM